MRPTHASIIVLTLGTFAVAGCGGTPGNSASTINDYQAGVYRAYCDWQLRCGVISAGELQRCYDLFNLISSGPIDFAVLVDGKRVAFDASAAGRCLDALHSASCRSLFGAGDPGSCSTAARGLIQPGDACTTDLECAGGYCSATQQGCAGKCVAFPAVGSACTSFKGCGPDAVCDAMSSTCKARQAAGSACVSTSECKAGLGCVRDAMGKGSCTAPGAAGAPCIAGQGSSQCADGLYCDAAAKSCKAHLGGGAVCGAAAECKAGLTCVGLTVDMQGATGACGAYLGAGAACTPGKLGCPLDAPCDGATKTCKGRGIAGTACVTSNDCDFATYCDGTSHKCSERAAYGAACTPPVGDSTDPCAIGSCEAGAKKCLILCP